MLGSLPVELWLAFSVRVRALEKCDVLFAMDSGPRHLADAQVATPSCVYEKPDVLLARVEAGVTAVDLEIDLAPPDAPSM